MLLQIDGLSSRRLERALARGDMPHLGGLLHRGEARLRPLRSATTPSTPVFTAGLLYGACADIPGFGWYDRTLKRVVRMDVADDVSALEARLRANAAMAPLLAEGISYGTIWPGGALDTFFNVQHFSSGAPQGGRTDQNGWDRLSSATAALASAGRLGRRLPSELARALWDFQRWCRRVETTRLEWRFLYMRLFTSLLLREVAAQGAVLDVLRGVPLVYADFLGYDEVAHRRGPDSATAWSNLSGIDAAIARILAATRAVPEYRYDLYVLSDHGQSTTVPFEQVTGCGLQAFVLSHAAARPGRPLPPALRTLIAARALELRARTTWAPLRSLLARSASRLRHAAEPRLAAALRGIEVVTGGSIAHLYFERDGERHGVDRIAWRWPGVLEALIRCRAIGLIVGSDQEGAPVVYHRGLRYRLADRRGLESIPLVRALGYELFRVHAARAAHGACAGDLVLYGAGAAAGEVSFDFEFGSHGGLGPEELDQFVIHPTSIEPPLDGEVRAEDFYRFFHARYVEEDEQARRAG